MRAELSISQTVVNTCIIVSLSFPGLRLHLYAYGVDAPEAHLVSTSY